MAITSIRKDIDGTVILSSMGPNSKCSTTETIAPARTPAIPNITPAGIENATN